MQANKFLSLKKNGFTLIELIIASSAAGLVALLLVSTLGIFENESKRTRALITKQTIIADIRSALLSKASLKSNLNKTIDGSLTKLNLALFNCLCGVGTCQTLKKPDDSVFIYSSSGLLLSPQFYSDSGASCSQPTSSNCIYSVTAVLLPVCPPDFNLTKLSPKKNCNGEPAEYVAVKYTIESNTVNNPKSQLIKPTVGYIYIESANVVGSGMCL